jgi:hypothetical protein
VLAATSLTVVTMLATAAAVLRVVLVAELGDSPMTGESVAELVAVARRAGEDELDGEATLEAICDGLGRPIAVAAWVAASLCRRVAVLVGESSPAEGAVALAAGAV